MAIALTTGTAAKPAPQEVRKPSFDISDAAYAAVEAHGERIELQGEPGRGSTFTILLPTDQGDSA